jgi:hypothetical protein
MATLYDLVDLWTDSDECYFAKAFNGILNEEEDRIDLDKVDKKKAAEDLEAFAYGTLEGTITEEQAMLGVDCVINYLEDSYQPRAWEYQRCWWEHIQKPLQDIDVGKWMFDSEEE